MGLTDDSKSKLGAFLVVVPTVTFAILIFAFAWLGPSSTPIGLAVTFLVFGALFTFGAMVPGNSDEEMPIYSTESKQTKNSGKNLALGASCCCAVFVGCWQGCWIHASYFHPYFGYSSRPTYTNVLPSDLASARADAAVIGFDSQAVVDTFRAGSVSSSDFTLFCVAPIFDESGQSRAEFWAVGLDCCGKSGGFYCDDSQDMSCKSGLVIRDENSTFAPPIFDMYMQAVNATAAKYQLQIPDRPVLLQWKNNPEDLMNVYLVKGIIHMIVATVFSLVMFSGIALVTVIVTGKAEKSVSYA